MSLVRIEQYYREEYSRLVKIVGRRYGLGDHAQDVIQTAFERALRYHQQLDPEREIGPWMNTIIFNCVSDHFRSERGIVFEELDELNHMAGWGEVEANHLYDTVKTLISKENPDYQPILELHFLQGYSSVEIYQFNSFSYPNTRKIIQRFRDKARKELKSLE